MKKISLLIFVILSIFSTKAIALIEVDITRGNLNPLPVAVSPLSIDDKSRKSFENLLKKKNIGEEISSVVENNLKTSQPNENNELTVSWNENEASGIGLFGQRGRVFDLIVVGRPTPGALTPAMNTLETVLFESGRPVLIAPPTITPKIINHIAIAWNGSTETARTIAFAMPLIKNAKHISVLNIEGAMVPGPTAVEVANSLTRQDITVDIINREGKRSPSDAGALMLNETENIGADLLIKGGYTQSRLRQMIFGGATNHILNEAKMPVLMAH